MLNENKGDEMIQILQHLQQYIPEKEYEDELCVPNQQELIKTTKVLQHKILLGGDQLTVARVRGAQTAMCNGIDAVKRLEGFIPVIQDWHAKVVLLEVCHLNDTRIIKVKILLIFIGDLEILL